VPGLDDRLDAARSPRHALPAKGQEDARRQGSSEFPETRGRSLHFLEHLGTMGGYELFSAVSRAETMNQLKAVR
jgi:hypothetical protein